MMDWGGGGWGGGYWMMFLFSIVFIVAVIVGIVFLVRGMSGGGAEAAPWSGRPKRNVRPRRSSCGGATPPVRSTARSTSRSSETCAPKGGAMSRRTSLLMALVAFVVA